MDALYCFCFAPGNQTLNLDVAGCGWENPVEVLRLAGFQVVLSRVAAERFVGAVAEERLADPTWLVPLACAHDAVIARVMDATTPYPLSFGTLFSSLQALALELANARPVLLAFFERMSGRTEYGVKVILDRERALAALARDVETQRPETGSTGLAYLQRQRRKVAAERALGPWLGERVARIDAELAPYAETILIRPASEPAVASRACLIEPGGTLVFTKAIQRLRDEMMPLGLDLHGSGPWPLYSFRSLS